MEVVPVNSRNATLPTEGIEVKPLEKIIDITRIVAMEVTDIKGCIQWPKLFGNKKNFSNSAISSCYDSWRINHRNIMVVCHASRANYWDIPEFSSMTGEIVTALKSNHFA